MLLDMLANPAIDQHWQFRTKENFLQLRVAVGSQYCFRSWHCKIKCAGAQLDRSRCYELLLMHCVLQGRSRQRPASWVPSRFKQTG